MFHNFHVRLRYWFYPTGNTPAVNMTRDTRKQKDEKIAILSLGCGDPRNILYTAWCEETQPLSFTCCDHEAAIIARNVLLFAALTRSGETTWGKHLWSAFYHFFIPLDTAKVLLLLLKELVGASESLQKWKSSSFGGVIRFSSATTVFAVRKFWQEYELVLDMPETDHAAYERRVGAEIAEVFDQHVGQGAVLTGMRSAGARYMASSTAVSKAFREFWKTGVVAGNLEDVVKLKGGKRVNPLFSTSSSPSKRFAVHYGTDPLLGFHLSEAFQASGQTSVLSAMVSIAQRQFNEWCGSLHQALSSKRVTCVFHHGDAISLCYRLQWGDHGRVPIFSTLWASEELVVDGLDDGCDRKFDVIDTSNLLDHLGVLTLFPAVKPLLVEHAASVLYSETLLRAASTPKDSLEALLLADPTAMFLICGLAPSGVLTGVSTDMISNNDNFSQLLSRSNSAKGRLTQCLIRISWRFACAGDSQCFKTGMRSGLLEVHPQNLINFLYTIYTKMFVQEDLGQLQDLMRRKAARPMAGDVLTYTRTIFASFLALVRRNIRTDWTYCMDQLIEKIATSSASSVGLNYIQEFLTWLHLLGVYSDKSLQKPVHTLPVFQSASTRLRKRLPLLFDTPNAPHVVYLALAVPRKNIEYITSADAGKIGTPCLHLEIANFETRISNCFQAINGFYGRLESTGKGAAKVVTGSQDFLAICAVPAIALLAGDPDDTMISLGLSPSISTISLMSDLGLRLKLFETNFSDEAKVHILLQPPSFRTTGQLHAPDISDLEMEQRTTSVIEFETSLKAENLRLRLSTEDIEDLSTILASGTAVSIGRISPCVIQLKVGTIDKQIAFPFPIDATASKVRIARKSGWLEIIAPLSLAFAPGGYDPERFPVLLHGKEVLSWGLSTLNLDKTQVIPKESNSDWIEHFLGQTLSETDRKANRSSTTTKSALLQVKESIHLITQSYFRRHPSRPGVPVLTFNLTDQSRDCDTILLVNSIRHDVGSSSIVIDAHVICLSHTRMKSMIPVIQSMPRDEVALIAMSTEEMKMWKALLPALVERARGHRWSHRQDCEYTRAGKIPLSDEHGAATICACGEGRDLDSFRKAAKYKRYSKFATRIALSPLAAVPYVEKIVDESLMQALFADREEQHDEGSNGCDSCGARGGKLQTCGRCGKVQYCDQKCQKKAWKQHKTVCSKS